MDRSRWPLAGTLAGALVGCLVVAALIASGALRIPPHRDDRDASADFLTAWSRSRTGTFTVESDFRRRLGDGRTLYSASKLVQSPPNRIIRQFGGIDGVVNGHPIICSTDQGGNFSCFAGTAPTVGFDEGVARELDTFRSYFAEPGTPLPPRAAPSGTTLGSTTPPGTTPAGTTPAGTAPPGAGPAAPPGTTLGSTTPPGTTPPGTGAGAPGTTEPLVALGLYRVGYGLDPGCFELFQRIPYPDPPYGSYAKFCFEQDTGALTLLERHLANNVVETLQAYRTTVAVTPSDFDTSADESYKLRMDLGGFPEPTTPDAAAPGTTVPPGADPAGLAGKSNKDLIVDGSEVVRLRRGDAKPYVAEAVRRMAAGQLSINSPDWIDGGRVRELLVPVVYQLLGTGIYGGPTS